MPGGKITEQILRVNRPGACWENAGAAVAAPIAQRRCLREIITQFSIAGRSPRAILRFPVLRNLLVIIAAVALAGCQESQYQESKIRVLIGATLITSPGAPPREDTILVIVGNTIRGIGSRSDMPVPQNSERVDLQGKWVVSAGETAVAEGQPASLNVLDHPPSGGDEKPVRRMVAGNWLQ